MRAGLGPGPANLIGRVADPGLLFIGAEAVFLLVADAHDVLGLHVGEDDHEAVLAGGLVHQRGRGG